MKKLFIRALLCFCVGTSFLDNTSASPSHNLPAASTLLNKPYPVLFIENIGQITDQFRHTRKDIDFVAKAAPGISIFIGNGSIHYQFSKRSDANMESKNVIEPGVTLIRKDEKQVSYEMYRMDIEFVGANKNAEIVKEGQQYFFENYFVPNVDPIKSTAHSYGKIIYKNIYPHIDWVVYEKEGKFKHEFIVNTGGRISDIKLKYSGATDLKINVDGSLSSICQTGEVKEFAPVSYQENGEIVESAFRLDGAILSYYVGHYTGKLIVDPTLVWGTYFGDLGDEQGYAITIDSSDFVSIAGLTTSAANIATVGAYQTTFGGTEDAFIAKFSNIGARQWSTYYGGIGDDVARGITCDGLNNLYITGFTTSASGIATPGAYHTTYGGAGGYLNTFLAKFNSAGSLQWGTYCGSTFAGTGYGIAADSAGDVFVTGQADSTLDISSSLYPSVYGGALDAFLTKFNSSGVIQWATYYGGAGNDYAYSIALDRYNNAYITGATQSASGIATAGTYQTLYGSSLTGTYDAYLAKFTSNGQLQWGTYFGDAGVDYGYGVTSDLSGNVFLAGLTSSTANIASMGAYQVALSGNNDAFLAKFNNTGNVQWATYFGGANDDGGGRVKTDNIGNVYFAGYTSSASGIATAGAYQTTLGGLKDCYLAKFNSTGGIQWATYYGGSGDEYTSGIARDDSGYIYLTGLTQSSANVATTGAFQTSYGGGGKDAVIAKFFDCFFPDAGVITGPSSVCLAASTSLSVSASGGSWSSSNSSATVVSGIVAGVASGVDTIVYSVSNGCGFDSSSHVITIDSIPNAGFISGLDTVCMLSTIVLTSSVATGTWSSSNSGIATVAGGIVWGVASGADTIRYSVSNSCGTAVVAKIIYVASCLTDVELVNSIASQIELYPNPTINEVHVDHAVNCTVTITNILGQQVLHTRLTTDKATINIESISTGMYMVQITDPKTGNKVVRRLNKS